MPKAGMDENGRNRIKVGGFILFSRAPNTLFFKKI